MAPKKFSMGLTMIVATILYAGIVVAQTTDCTNVLISMSPCLNYISGNSSTPSSGCCSQLRTVLGSKPECLCQVINGGTSNLGLNINQTQAMALPGACNVQTPPLSRCNAASPAGSPDSAPDSPNTNSGSGSKTVPSGGGSSGAASSESGVAMLLGLMLIASYVTISNMA